MSHSIQFESETGGQNKYAMAFKRRFQKLRLKTHVLKHTLCFQVARGTSQ